jgi:hypothetical protein
MVRLGVEGVKSAAIAKTQLSENISELHQPHQTITNPNSKYGYF